MLKDLAKDLAKDFLGIGGDKSPAYYNLVSAKNFLKGFLNSKIFTDDDMKLIMDLGKKKWQVLLELVKINKERIATSKDRQQFIKNLALSLQDSEIFFDHDAKKLLKSSQEKVKNTSKLLDFDRYKLSPKSQQRTILTEVVADYYQAPKISEQELKTNLDQGLIEIFYDNGQHRCNGILITNNGYFITCHHCLDTDLSGIYANTRFSKKQFPINICASSKRFDLALGKINLNGPETARQYKFHSSGYGLLYGRPLMMTSLHHGELRMVGGVGRQARHVNPMATGETYYDQLECYLEVHPGNSGSIATTIDGAIVGLLSAGAYPNTMDYSCNISTWNHVLELLAHYTY